MYTRAYHFHLTAANFKVRRVHFHLTTASLAAGLFVVSFSLRLNETVTRVMGMGAQRDNHEWLMY